MGTRQSQQRQDEIRIANAELARSPGHPFHQRLNDPLDDEKFDAFVEDLLPKVLLCVDGTAHCTVSFGQCCVVETAGLGVSGRMRRTEVRPV